MKYLTMYYTVYNIQLFPVKSDWSSDIARVLIN